MGIALPEMAEGRVETVNKVGMKEEDDASRCEGGKNDKAQKT